MIGGGMYALSTFNQAREVDAWLYLVMLANQVGKAIKEWRPGAVVGLRPDWGKDGEQWSGWALDQGDRAAAWWVNDVIAPVLMQYPGVFDFVTGWNEPLVRDDPEWLRFLADFEWGCCRRLQYGQEMPADWRPIRYAALTVQVGNLEPEEVFYFEKVIRHAWALAFHVYLSHYVTTIRQEYTDWYAYRPLRILLPYLRAINPDVRLIFTECGTYYPPLQTGITKDDEARCQVEIAATMEQEALARGAKLVGTISYGVGLDGNQKTLWSLDGQTAILAEANRGCGPVELGPIPPLESEPVKWTDMEGQPWQEAEQKTWGQLEGGNGMNEAEFERWCADVFKRAGVPYNPESALIKRWKLEAQAGNYLGKPEGPEHPTENGKYVIQEFSSAVLTYDRATGKVANGLPLGW